MRRRHWVLGSLLTAAAGSSHVGYPAWLALASRRAERRGSVPAAPVDPAEWPAVTVLVPAYREAGVIAAKVEDVRANGYPGPLEIMVLADGDPETGAAAEKAGARVFAGLDRLGKSQALNLGFAQADTPVVVISDANNRLAPGGLAALVRHFADPLVGAVTGEKVEDDEGGGESMYWHFESWLKRRESALGTTIGLVGEFTAFRAEAWQPIPDDVAIDDLWSALDLSERGWSIRYEPAARAIDPPSSSLAEQWERRTRSVANAMYVFRQRPYQLGPSGGLVAVEIWGHRLGRYTVSPLAHAALVGLALRRAGSSQLARVFLAGHAVGLWGIVKPPAPGKIWRKPVVIISQVMFLQGVALGGLARHVRGSRETTWTTVER